MEWDWYRCPHCGQKIFMICDNTVIRGLKIKCKGRNCGKIVEVYVGEKKIKVSR